MSPRVLPSSEWRCARCVEWRATWVVVAADKVCTLCATVEELGEASERSWDLPFTAAS